LLTKNYYQLLSVKQSSLGGLRFLLLVRPDLLLHCLPVNLDVLGKLGKPFVGFRPVVHLKEALAVRNYCVYVRLVVHCDFQRAVPLVHLDIQLDGAVKEAR